MSYSERAKLYQKAYYLKHRERLLEKSKSDRLLNGDRIRAYRKEFQSVHRDVLNAKARAYYAKNKEHQKLQGSVRLRTLRLMVLDLFGGKCNTCGFADYRALQIDHKDGGGTQERKELYKTGPGRFYRFLLNGGDKSSYQLLCANCNWIKRYDNNEHTINKNIDNAAILAALKGGIN